MMRIRLRRVGRKNYAQYRIVVTPIGKSVKGNYIERVGFFNPHSKLINIDKERLLDWIGKGAQVSNTVAKLMKIQKISHPLIKIKLNAPRPPKKKEEKPEEVRVPDAQDESKNQAINKNQPSAPEINPAQDKE